MTTRTSNRARHIGAKAFLRRYTTLVVLAWTLPTVVGFLSLLFIGMFSAEQLAATASGPWKALHTVVVLTAMLAFFWHYARPLAAFLDNPVDTHAEGVVRRIRRFPLIFWGLFLAHLLTTPSIMLWAAVHYAGFQPIGEDWFRIHLVALSVFILVGLPIFFRLLDLFGQFAPLLRLRRPYVSLKTKAFLVGAFVPLLIATLLVQYYWTRTGYFSSEALLVWLGLEGIAILGTLVFLKGIDQALRPLQGVLGGASGLSSEDLSALQPQSTDEVGVLAGGYRQLLEDLRVRNELLRVSNRITATGESASLGEVMGDIMALCQGAIGGDDVFMILHDPAAGELAVVAHLDAPYDPEGHFRISLDNPSLVVRAFKQGKTAVVENLQADSSGCPTLATSFGFRSVIAAPLRAEGQVIGVLLSADRERRSYPAELVSLMEAFAGETALAVHAHILLQERAAMEAARQEREEQVRLLLNFTAEAIFGVDLEGRCTFVNPACVRMLGYQDESELLGNFMHPMIHHTRPDGTPYPKAECRVRLATMAGRSGHSDQEVHWRADGTSFPVEWWSHPVYKDGEIIGTVVTFVDVTERRAAEEKLRRLSEYNRLLLESTSDGIFGVDEELRCTFVNQAAAEMLGYSADALRGQDMHALVLHSREDGSPLPREQSLLLRAIREGSSFWSDSEVLWQKGNSPFPVQYSANPIHENGQVTGAVVVFRDVAEARAMARKMDYLATHDPLTGLVNRREFERRLQSALESAMERDEEHILCYLDLDQFKVVNDTCGHVAGDELLRQLTTLLHTKVRHSDTLARLGGDEFGVLFEHCPLEHALQLANELWATVQDFRFVWDDKTFSVGVSIGVVPITAGMESVASALSAADSACYLAKDSGRNRVHVYEADDVELARRRGEMQWVSRIRDALDQDRFELYYQPIVPVGDSDSQPLIEILLRMQDEDGGTIPPGAFLPAAERYNLITALDRWVVRTVFHCLREHCERLDQVRMCTINLSGHSLGDESFLTFVIEQVESLQIMPGKVCFEVTETAAVANLTDAARFMHRLKAYGFSFALDDFGSGMSSFAYLKNLPVDFLKIDGNFVRDMARDPIDRAMVEAINQVGHVMGIRTIAEFVENEDILRELRAIGVDFGQGYGIAMPKPLESMFSEGHTEQTAS